MDRVETRIVEFLEIVWKSHVTTWWPSISPHDDSLFTHLHTTALDIVTLLAASIKNRHDQQVFTRLLLSQLPTIIKDHLESWNRAVQNVRAQTDGTLDERQFRQAVASRYHVLNGHEAIEYATAPDPPTTSQLDKSLDEAMSSSLHQPPPSPRAVNATTRHPPPPLGTPKYVCNLDYLTTLSSRLVHLYWPPSPSPPSTLETTFITHLLASTVLNTCVTKLSQGWMLTRVALAVFGDSPDARSKQSVHSSSPAPLSASWFGIAYHTCIVLAYTLSSTLLLFSSTYTKLMHHYHLASAHELTTKTIHNASEPVLHLIKTWLQLAYTPTPTSPGMLSRAPTIVEEIWTWVGMVAGPLGLGNLTDRLIPCYIQNEVLTASNSALAIEKLCTTLYPNGLPAPPVPDPSQKDIDQMQQALLDRVSELVPNFLTSGYLATTDRVIHHQAWRKLLIDPFTDPDVNIHLIVRILEAIILAIDPRVAETVVARV